MNKTQRKREAREKKARAKAARKAKNQALRETASPAGDRSTELTAGGGSAPVASSDLSRASDRGDAAAVGNLPTACAGKDARTTDAGIDSHITKDARTSDAGRDAHTTKDARTTTAEDVRREFQAQLDADPELRETLQAVYGQRIEQRKLDRTVEQAEDDLGEARDMVAQARELEPEMQYRRKITDQRALEMLEDAAEATHEVLLMVRDALRGVSPERREAARAILNEKPVSGVDGRKLPRRAPDPVVTLMKLELQASSLVKRILAKTNPGVGKKAA